MSPESLSLSLPLLVDVVAAAAAERGCGHDAGRAAAEIFLEDHSFEPGEADQRNIGPGFAWEKNSTEKKTLYKSSGIFCTIPMLKLLLLLLLFSLLLPSPLSTGRTSSMMI